MLVTHRRICVFCRLGFSCAENSTKFVLLMCSGFTRCTQTADSGWVTLVAQDQLTCLHAVGGFSRRNNIPVKTWSQTTPASRCFYFKLTHSLWRNHLLFGLTRGKLETVSATVMQLKCVFCFFVFVNRKHSFEVSVNKHCWLQIHLSIGLNKHGCIIRRYNDVNCL